MVAGKLVVQWFCRFQVDEIPFTIRLCSDCRLYLGEDGRLALRVKMWPDEVPAG